MQGSYVTTKEFRSEISVKSRGDVREVRPGADAYILPSWFWCDEGAYDRQGVYIHERGARSAQTDPYIIPKSVDHGQAPAR